MVCVLTLIMTWDFGTEATPYTLTYFDNRSLFTFIRNVSSGLKHIHIYRLNVALYLDSYLRVDITNIIDVKTDLKILCRC